MLPKVAHWQLRLFSGYVSWYLRRHFHSLQLKELGPVAKLPPGPLLICLNHPSWWDPLLALHLSQRFFPGRAQYAPIAAKGVEKYRFFEKLGFFGIDPESRSGAQRFLSVGDAVLERDDGVLWVTAQGHFSDVRTRPVMLEPGVGHLAHRAHRPFVMVPLALEYAFWEERTPEAFACWGVPVPVENGSERSAAGWTREFAQALEGTMSSLSTSVAERRAHEFAPILQGQAGVGGVYDLWRATKAAVRGKRFRAEHGGTLL